MKKLKFLLAALLTLMCANVWAQKDAAYWQSKAVSEIVNGGEYYIYSPKYNMFLSRGYVNGAQATLDYQGLPWQVIKSGDTYTFLCKASDGTFSNRLLFWAGNGIFLDRDKDENGFWTVNYVSEKSYTIKNSTQSVYLRRSGGATKLSSSNEADYNSSSDKEQFNWYFIPKSDRESITGASYSNPIDVTYYIYDQNMDYYGQEATISNKGHWVANNGSPTWRNENDNVNTCAQVSNSKFNISQTLTNIPNGIYRLKAQGFYRVGDGSNDPSKAAIARSNDAEVINAYFYANDEKEPFPSIFDNNCTENRGGSYVSSTGYDIKGTTYYVPTTMDRASAWFSDGYYETSLVVEVIDHTLKIGAGNDVENTEQWAIFDNFRLEYLGTGTYHGFLYTEVGDKIQFLTRGYTDNTRAILGDYGVPVHLMINNGNDKIKFLDSQQFLYSWGTDRLYTDIAFNDKRIRMVISEEDGGYILQANNSVSNGYIGVYDEWKLKHVDNKSDALVWKIMSKTEYDKILAQRDEAGRYAGYGKTVIGSIPELDVVKDKIATETSNRQEQWNMRNFKKEWNYTDMTPGLYKVSVNTFYRIGGWDKEFAQAQSGYNYHLAFLTANGKSVLIKSALDGKTTQKPSIGGWASQAIDGVTYYIPDNLDGADWYFDNGYYENVIYANVEEDGKLDISLSCDEYIPFNWWAYRDLEITRMDNEHLLVDINEYGASTFSSTRSYQVPKGLEAWYATSCDGSSVSMTKIENGIIPANTGVVLRGEKGQYTLTLVNDASAIAGTNLLVAVSEKVNGLAAQVNGNTNYILYNGTFCTWDNTATVNVAAGKAYLSVPASSDVKNYVLDWGEADGIETVAQPVNGSNEKVFNLAGQAVGNDYRGIVIMNGKKVMKK